jgi:mRNA-degrading endonuclease HigB of HigAB toxin-antitoxin module
VSDCTKNTTESTLKDGVKMFQYDKAPLKEYENKVRKSQWQYIGLGQVFPHGVSRDTSVQGRK